MTAIHFIEDNQHNFNKITWYLSGGIKFGGKSSEAFIMKKELNKVISARNLDEFIDYHYILDEKSKNTAENLYRSSLYLNTSQEIYDDVYIITSTFHHNRAQLMMSYIDPSRSYSWILGDMTQHDSFYWESVHIQNVAKDVEKLSSIEL
jgi:hypothetical protein